VPDSDKPVRFYRKEGDLGLTNSEKCYGFRKSLPGFPMDCVAGATRAILLEFHPFVRLILGLGRGIVPFGAFNASQNRLFVFLFRTHFSNNQLFSESQ